MAERFIEGILKILNDGTLVLPTLSWREVSPDQPFWSEIATRSNVGILSEIFRTRFAVRRSLHPTHSAAAVGPQSDFLLRDHHLEVRPCSETSPWGRLGETGATILMLGTEIDACTLIHHFEEIYAPEIYLRKEVESYQCEDASSVSIEVRTRRHCKLLRNYYKFKDMLSSLGLLKSVGYDGYSIYAFKATDMASCLMREFEKSELAVIAQPGDPCRLM
jgi:aminoglycoside 3-N-acetyltransferase